MSIIRLYFKSQYNANKYQHCEFYKLENLDIIITKLVSAYRSHENNVKDQIDVPIFQTGICAEASQMLTVATIETSYAGFCCAIPKGIIA